MDDESRWLTGQPILLRDVYKGQIKAAIPVTVVEDGPDRLVFYVRPGTPFCLMADADGRLTKDVFAGHRLVELRWQGYEQLSIVLPGEAHAVIARWEGPERRFVHWHVNLQSPLVRTPLGFDASDHILDVVISADGQSYEWKDENDFMRAAAAGYFTPQEAAAIHGESERVIALARKQKPPFGEGWEKWRPDPAWVLPCLPPGWDAPPAGPPGAR